MINTVSSDSNTTNAHHSSTSLATTAAGKKRLKLKIKRNTYHGKITHHEIIHDKDKQQQQQQQQQQVNNKTSATMLTTNNTKAVIPLLSKVKTDENINSSSTATIADDNNICNEYGDNESEKSENDTLTTTTTTTTTVQVKVKTTKTSRKRKLNSENNTDDTTDCIVDSNNEKTRQSTKSKRKCATLSNVERQNSNDDTTIPSTPLPSRVNRSSNGSVSSIGVHTEQDAFGPCEPGSSVLLEGIVWNETDKGVLVINVTWRGKTYVGALLNTTEQNWAPPRYKNDPRQNHRLKNNHYNTLSSSLPLLSSSSSLSLSQSNPLSISGTSTQTPADTNSNEPTERILRNGKRRGTAIQQQTIQPASPGDFKVPPLPTTPTISKDLSPDMGLVKNELDSLTTEPVSDNSSSLNKTIIDNENGLSTAIAAPSNYSDSTNGKDDDESSTSSGFSTTCSPQTTCNEAKTEIKNELKTNNNHDDTHVESVTPIDLSKTTTELGKDTEKIAIENMPCNDSLKISSINDSINDNRKPLLTTTKMDFIQKRTSPSDTSHQSKNHDRFSHHHHHFSKSHHSSKSNKSCSKLDSTTAYNSNSNKIKSIPASPSPSTSYQSLSPYHQSYFSPHHQPPPMSPFSPFRPEMAAAFLGYQQTRQQQSSSPPHHGGERLSPTTKNMLNTKAPSPYLQLPSPVQQQLYFNSLLHAQNHSRYQAAATYSKSSR
ncbi:unnamed protein product [Didymodactylos carnosus]|uniref:Uncharacterized protein n=1 Tax=Didymodactylos carnosus TaxID=1234261 RepID=A0A813NMY2_9BILA|nr:unnamed protein product [Didymodactylos carnosus]CAF0876695.1 unnamed protein product [Didymodactylos carnosus]CAF3519447.1 unnamed protein product [Didymodactylos carnosus]CAF3661035.1 unnamed protein product [Didymodactylos carnosus]